MCLLSWNQREANFKGNGLFFVVLDIDPIQEGHLLLIAKKHYHSRIEIPEEELMDLF
ncbi:HIT family protein [Enterococcus sp. LJL90]